MEEVKKKVEEILKKIKNDKNFAKNFKKDPINAVESVVGIDLPDEKIKEIVTAVKTKLKLDETGIVDKLKGLLK